MIHMKVDLLMIWDYFVNDTKKERRKMFGDACNAIKVTVNSIKEQSRKMNKQTNKERERVIIPI